MKNKRSAGYAAILIWIWITGMACGWCANQLTGSNVQPEKLQLEEPLYVIIEPGTNGQMFVQGIVRGVDVNEFKSGDIVAQDDYGMWHEVDPKDVSWKNMSDVTPEDKL